MRVVNVVNICKLICLAIVGNSLVRKMSRIGLCKQVIYYFAEPNTH